jgi:multidrug transporter EmrE-like cation transporter
MTKLAASVPSVIMFPLFNGSGIILVTLLSAWMFKEKLTARRITGFVVGLIGLFLASFLTEPQLLTL